MKKNGGEKSLLIRFLNKYLDKKEVQKIYALISPLETACESYRFPLVYPYLFDLNRLKQSVSMAINEEVKYLYFLSVSEGARLDNNPYGTWIATEIHRWMTEKYEGRTLKDVIVKDKFTKVFEEINKSEMRWIWDELTTAICESMKGLVDILDIIEETIFISLENRFIKDDFCLIIDRRKIFECLFELLDSFIILSLIKNNKLTNRMRPLIHFLPYFIPICEKENEKNSWICLVA